MLVRFFVVAGLGWIAIDSGLILGPYLFVLQCYFCLTGNIILNYYSMLTLSYTSNWIYLGAFHEYRNIYIYIYI